MYIIAILGVIVLIAAVNTQAFVLSHRRVAPPLPHHPLFGGTSSSPRNNYFSKSSQPGASLQMERPSDMPHQEYISLTKEQKRNLPDARYGFIDVEGHPKLTARDGQVNFKIPKHGKIHGLPTNENDKKPKTEKSAFALRDSLVKMPEREGIYVLIMVDTQKEPSEVMIL